MSLRLDHVVIVVRDLDAGVRDFTSAGFVVVPGGRHDVIPTANAVVIFPDGGYLELLAVRDHEALASLVRARAQAGGMAHDDSPVVRRFMPHLLGLAGVVDYALCGMDVASTAAAMQQNGIPTDGPVSMSRERPDGTLLAWDMWFPATVRLPFLIRDRTERNQRVPSDPALCAHSNGASGVEAIWVHAGDPARAASEYAAGFAVVPDSLPSGRLRLSLGDLPVIVTQGEAEGARAVILRGSGALPECVESLGVRFADS